MTLRPELSTSRLATRRALLDQLDLCGPFANALLWAHQDLMRKAYDLIDSPRVRDAFDLRKESVQARERYGHYRGGQACLLARRLVEAGVPWITIFFNHNIRGQDDHPEVADEYGWDTHNDIFTSLREHLLPSFDHSFSALLEDLQARGLLKDTLVVCMSEFGRAPRVAMEKKFQGSSPGRKHWRSATPPCSPRGFDPAPSSALPIAKERIPRPTRSRPATLPPRSSTRWVSPPTRTSPTRPIGRIA